MNIPFPPQDKGVAMLTASAVILMLVMSVVGMPGMYAYNEYVKDGGDQQTREDGEAFATAGSAVATGGGAMIAAGEATSSTAVVTAGATISTGGAAVATAGLAMLG